jgi:hypothetical protein
MRVPSLLWTALAAICVKHRAVVNPMLADLAPPARFEEVGVYAKSDDAETSRKLDELREKAEGSISLTGGLR